MPKRVVCDGCRRLRQPFSGRLCRACFQTKTYGDRLNTRCADCGDVKRHYARGLCYGCYQKRFMRPFHAKNERARRRKNPAHVRHLDKQRNQTANRREWKAVYQQTYYAANREKLLEYQRNYRRADPERRNNYKRRRRARVKQLPDTLTVEQWHAILKAHNHACAYCGGKDSKLEREHKIPASRGGGYTAENIVPACGRCNRRKKDMTDAEFRQYVQKHP